MELSKKILSDITVHMKYAKYIKEKNRRETWEEIVTRNMEMHLKKFQNLALDIENAYEYVYDKKILPSMRSMQFAGKPIELNPVRLYNCSFLHMNDWKAFSEIMFLLLSGTGVGYSVQFHHVDKLPEIKHPTKTKRYLVGDSIEGWSDAVRALVKSYFTGTPKPKFDFSDIRPKGAELITAGGKAPGPEPLKECLFKIEQIFERFQPGEKLRPIHVHIINCLLADAVLSGGIRRAAMIALFSFDDDEMMTCKFGNWWETNPEFGRSNNSAVILRNRIEEYEFKDLWEKIKASGSGEPGFFFTDDIEWGFNPCVEASLRARTFCNLCTINMDDIESQDDFENRIRAVTFIATLQASYTNFHYLRDEWKKATEKDSLIGISMTGIASQKIKTLGLDLEKGANLVKTVNAEVAKILGINPAARTTLLKPEGTSSLTLGTASGQHAWHAKYYKRRIRVGKNEPIYSYLLANYPELVEDDFFKSKTQAIITVPQRAPEGAITRADETALDSLERVKFLHKHWIKPGHRKGANTNNVSATITIKDHEWEEVGEWLWKNKKHYTALSFLPYDGHTYVQAPFEEITEEEYNQLFSKLKDFTLDGLYEFENNTDLQNELACAGGACEIV